MTILKDLLALRQPTQSISEARREGDMAELIEKWADQNKAYSWEGSRGIRQLEKLVRVLDSNYDDLQSFFTDNPGAIETVVEWIGTMRSSEWRENLEQVVGGSDDEDEDDDR